MLVPFSEQLLSFVRWKRLEADGIHRERVGASCDDDPRLLCSLDGAIVEEILKLLDVSG